MTAKGDIYVIEVNPLPGLTPGYSDLCLIAQAAGIEYRNLIGEILDGGLKRLREKRREAKSEAKQEGKPDSKLDGKPDSKPDGKPEPRAATNGSGNGNGNRAGNGSGGGDKTPAPAVMVADASDTSAPDPE
jgi:D-alanine-D-alanine ligase